jgi:hypothetical protein
LQNAVWSQYPHANSAFIHQQGIQELVAGRVVETGRSAACRHGGVLFHAASFL